MTGVTNVCIIDLETTGLDPEKDNVIELGAILYSVQRQTILEQFSVLFGVKENPQEAINKINAQATWEGSDLEFSAKDILYGFIERSDYFIAHNAEFDKQWPIFSNTEIPWLCTYSDFIWPHNDKPTSLINTCLNHGVAVTKAHRALTDCQLIAELFDRTSDLQELFKAAIARSQEPVYRVIANVNFDNRDLAKAAGFHWDSGTKRWYKDLKESDLAVQSKGWEFEHTKTYIP